MKLLLDTHALLWFVWNHPKLSATGRSQGLRSTDRPYSSRPVDLVKG